MSTTPRWVGNAVSSLRQSKLDIAQWLLLFVFAGPLVLLLLAILVPLQVARRLHARDFSAQ